MDMMALYRTTIVQSVYTPLSTTRGGSTLYHQTYRLVCLTIGNLVTLAISARLVWLHNPNQTTARYQYIPYMDGCWHWRPHFVGTEREAWREASQSYAKPLYPAVSRTQGLTLSHSLTLIHSHTTHTLSLTLTLTHLHTLSRVIISPTSYIHMYVHRYSIQQAKRAFSCFFFPVRAVEYVGMHTHTDICTCILAYTYCAVGRVPTYMQGTVLCMYFYIADARCIKGRWQGG